MNVLFITLSNIQEIDSYGIYEDLLREFAANKHQVYVVSPTERKNNKKTHIIKKHNCCILKVRTGNIQKTNIIEKGIATLTLEPKFTRAVHKYYRKIKFDLVLYSTPPITVAKAVKLVKKRDGAETYLLLKDIFPQNAVDIGMMNTSGVGSLLYRYFRNKERELYRLSDRIGCMSQANVDYVLTHNPEIAKSRVEVCPNCIVPEDRSVEEADRIKIRKKYGIPIDKKVFIYGGNLGKPQGIDFLIRCLRSQNDNLDAFFLIIGSGTEYGELESYISVEKPENVRLMRGLPKADYDCMVGSCDVGMIFLDDRFTIPNFPSRLLSYMKARLPVLAVTDPVTDIGKIIVDGGFGWWCESNDVSGFSNLMKRVCTLEGKSMGDKAFTYLQENYNVKQGYEIITNKICKDN